MNKNICYQSEFLILWPVFATKVPLLLVCPKTLHLQLEFDRLSALSQKLAAYSFRACMYVHQYLNWL